MDYQTYRQFRDGLLAGRSLLRLDCMNPAKALAFCIPELAKPEQALPAHRAQVIGAWSKATGIALDPQRTVIGSGVRELLAATFTCVLEPGKEVWLPEDVYPVYWELAKRAGLWGRAFTTLPQPDWNFLARAQKQAAMVLPVPLSPLGRMLTDAEVNALFHWLNASPRRLLLLDAVYTFDFAAVRNLMNLLLEKDAQCVVLWSCSKSWLSPGSMGLGLVPRNCAQSLQSQVSIPSEARLGRICAMLKGRPDLGRSLQESFHREWQRLAPHIRKAVPGWQPPSTGYFSTVSVPFNRLLDQHGILSVPASAFGAGRDDLSILTCLHDLAAHEKGGQA